MQSYKVFEFEGMPDDTNQQNNIVRESLQNTFVHVHNEDTGKYYVIVITEASPKNCKDVKVVTGNEEREVVANYIQSNNFQELF